MLHLMSKTFKLVLLALAIFALSTILAPPIYSLLPMFKFPKVFNRLIMIFGVAAAVLFVLISARKKKRGIFERESWREYGFDFSASWRRLFLYGFLVGALTVALMAAVEVAFGPRYLRYPLLLQDIVERFFKGMLSGMTIGMIEEFFFRGFIFSQLKKRMNIWIALIVTNAFYSSVHFFDNGQVFVPKDPLVGDGIRLLFGYLEPIVKRPLDILPEFVGLFLFGIVLNIAFIETRSLFFSIGIHAGTVFLIKFQDSFIREGPETYHRYFGSLPYYDGVFEWFALALLGCVVWWLTRKGVR